MHNFKKKLILSSLLAIGLFIQLSMAFPPAAGHRLHLTNIEIIKQKSKSAQIYVDIVNTGRFDIKMGKGKRMPYLEITFDNSLADNQLDTYQSDIREALLQRDTKIKVGETKERFFLKFKKSKGVQKSPLNTSPVTSREPKGEPVASTEIIMPASEKPSEPMEVEEVATEKKEKQSKTPKPKKQKKSKKKAEVFEAPVFEKKSLEEILAEKENCPDLVIESMNLIKFNNKKAVIEYTLKNVGKGPASIYDPSDKKGNAFGIRAYISGSDQITKGSFNVGGFYTERGLDKSNGMLNPNETFTETIEIDIRRKSRYMKVLIFSADAFLKLQECDRTNNTNHIILEK